MPHFNFPKLDLRGVKEVLVIISFLTAGYFLFTIDKTFNTLPGVFAVVCFVSAVIYAFIHLTMSVNSESIKALKNTISILQRTYEGQPKGTLSTFGNDDKEQEY